jgi:alkylation response protein AidB-like acyl-CoA dehydrogenase
MSSTSSYLADVERIAAEVVEPAAAEVDATGTFPRAGMDALARAGLLGLVSAADVGGLGHGAGAAAAVVRRLARSCASTAMVTCMHYAGTAVIEAHGPRQVRQDIAAGRHLTTLAFSEAGSRSHFWAPLSTAEEEGGSPPGETVVLNAQKSWVTSAADADSYVWSSLPVAAEGASTLWLVPSATEGLKVTAPFDGLGLRGNGSSPVAAIDARIPRAYMLGPDGGGFDIMMGAVLPLFQVMNAAGSVGIMESATTRAAAHLAATRYEHLDQVLAQQPVARAAVGRMRVRTDEAAALVDDTVAALEGGREDAMLRVLEVKASAGEAATEVTDLAMRACGGAAFRKEVGVERAFRDARAATVMAPTTDMLYDFIGRVVCGLPLFG